MQGYLLVALGGGLGAMIRYGVGQVSLQLGASGFPWATFFINISGGLLMGVLAGLLGHGGHSARLLLGVGVLGGYTTFSTFSLDTVRLVEAGQIGAALAYVVGSCVLSIGACWIGLLLTRTPA